MLNNLKLNGNSSRWADAHVFYNMFTHKPTDLSDKIAVDESVWRENMLNNAPNGSLLTDNSFFKCLKKNTVFLAHITPNLHNILEQNNLYPSSGCLVGSIYCVPISDEDGKLRIYNLGEYVFKKEMPRFLGKQAADSGNILIIKLNMPDVGKNNLIGVDYLRLGNIHFDTYHQLEYLLSSQERNSLKESCVERVRAATEYLSLCDKIYHCSQHINNVDFFKVFNAASEHLPVLGYFYFEAISEYIMLFQDSDTAIVYKKIGEFFSPSYKDLVSNLSPQLSQNFSLRQFRPNIKEVIHYIDSHQVFKEFNPEKFVTYLTKRLCFLTNARLLNHRMLPIEWDKIQWNFDYLSQYISPLLGHLIHRELRTFKRYPHFYFYFDQYKALQVWNYWNHMNIVIPFNGVMPKGEVGINPAYTNLDYQFFTSRMYSQNGFAYLEPQKEVEINIVPKLVDLKFTSMRNKDHHQIV